jgi:hypothetical protein
MLDQVFPGANAVTEQHVQRHWRAIERVAAAPLRGGCLKPDWLDVLIADAAAEDGA